jgi:hypothetical protein
MGLYVLVAMFVGVGILFTWLGWSNVVSTRREIATWLHVDGTVTGLEEQPDSKGYTLYAPVYRYHADGEHTATSKTASRPASYKVGDTVRLVVNPSNASESEVIDATTGIFSYGLMAAGVVALAVGLLVLWLVVSGQVH